MGEVVLNPATGKAYVSQDPGAMVQRAGDAIRGGGYVSTPADFAAQYPTPLDTTEILAMCEEITMLQSIPEIRTGLKQETWREISADNWVTGSNLIAFQDGGCPETYTHTGSNQTVSLKNIGVYQSLTLSDILHSAAIASANWNGINRLVAGPSAAEGFPGEFDGTTFLTEHVADVKEKEIRLGMTLLLNGWDRLLVSGDATTRPLEFDGIEKWFVNDCTPNVNDNSASGTFAAADYNRFLGTNCAKPTHIMGHPTAVQEMMSAYFALGFNGSSVIYYNNNERIVPGFNFTSFVNTADGRLQVIADVNFARTQIGGGAFQSKLYALRMVHNGEPLVYRSTQIPVSMKDLVPGCTSIAFEIFAKTALIIKMCCAHSVYNSQFTGKVSASGCTRIG